MRCSNRVVLLDGDTNWYTVTSFRQLGTHVASSVHKGERVIVCGRVRIRDWTSGEKAGTTIEIDAEAVGHDLTWGRASFTRSVIVGRGDGVDGGDGATDARPESDEAAAVPDDASQLAPRELVDDLSTPF